MKKHQKSYERKYSETRAGDQTATTKEQIREALADLLRECLIEIVSGSIPPQYRVVKPS